MIIKDNETTQHLVRWIVAPVTAERTNAEVEAMKLGAVAGGRELQETVK
jgi:hypothetical protein